MSGILRRKSVTKEDWNERWSSKSVFVVKSYQTLHDFFTISRLCIFSAKLKIFQLYCAIWWSESIWSDAAESASWISEGSLENVS